MKIRFCDSKEFIPLVDLGFAPPSNAYIEKSKKYNPELNYSLKVNVCKNLFSSSNRGLH